MIKLNDMDSTMIAPSHVSFMRITGHRGIGCNSTSWYLELVVGPRYVRLDYASEGTVRGDRDRIKEHAEVLE